MSNPIIEARGLGKAYGQKVALADVNLTIEPGRIVGLIGPNGSGKTTLIKSVLGLTPFTGDLKVLGRDPRADRNAIMQEVSFIADVAVLPKWLRVSQAVDYVAGVHPRFRRERAEEFLARTDIRPKNRVRELSKGMVTQLHLALILAIDARLLVLDEPTLGLDLLFRRTFYDTLLNEFFNEDRSILVTTHQVEEIEHILSDVVFVNRGRVLLDSPVEGLVERYHQLVVAPARVAEARALKPFYEREVFGRTAMLFEGVEAAQLEALGELRTPSIADLFVAKIQSQGAAA